MDPDVGTPQTTLRYFLLYFVLAGVTSVLMNSPDIGCTVLLAGSDHWNFEAFKSSDVVLMWVSIYRLYLYSEMMEYLLWLYVKFFLGQSTKFTRDGYKPMYAKPQIIQMGAVMYGYQVLLPQSLVALSFLRR
ncbi:hypothetical protein CI102_6018 [Trichoderma harzianum]|nr:hypothetical protein CI102_6018 [Trichoderma harzianum]